MRAFASALLLLGLALSPAMAAGPCTEITTPTNERVGYGTKGYEPVVVIVRVPVAQGKDVEAEAQKAFVRFWIAGKNGNLRVDDQRNIDTIHQCHFLYKQGTVVETTDKTYLRVRMLVDESAHDNDTYSLRAGIYLPKALIAQEPLVESELQDGAVLRGTWSKMRYSVKLPVNMKRRKGAPLGKLVDKTVMVTQLVLHVQ